MLVGNFIDWGAKAVTQLIEQTRDQLIDFEQAAGRIQSRPWLIDDCAAVVPKLDKYKCVAIFVDNSGADLLFGIIPFARELARHGSKVIHHLVFRDQSHFGIVDFFNLVLVLSLISLDLLHEFFSFVDYY